ncbi:hypothetical protein F2Q69_00042913 [Brassica cretica]|uniref:Uncharacterized protein n=1 Tax=Brassica cretica TaxID=69181 RepID=A0A8S9NHP1_BRACR|nr:hypothetical protein F2Q69_00042913 [Brassica cretica]
MERRDDTCARLMRHQFNLESLGDRLQKIEDATTIMKDKWRRGDEAMRDFTGTCPAVLEATRKLNYCSHQILQAWSVQSAKNHAPHRSITPPVHRSISVNHRQPRH